MSRPIRLQPSLSVGTECSSWPLPAVEVYRELSLLWSAPTEGAAAAAAAGRDLICLLKVAQELYSVVSWKHSLAVIKCFKVEKILLCTPLCCTV